jgi:hypothetical protein
MLFGVHATDKLSSIGRFRQSLNAFPFPCRGKDQQEQPIKTELPVYLKKENK